MTRFNRPTVTGGGCACVRSAFRPRMNANCVHGRRLMVAFPDRSAHARCASGLSGQKPSRGLTPCVDPSPSPLPVPSPAPCAKSSRSHTSTRSSPLPRRNRSARHTTCTGPAAVHSCVLRMLHRRIKLLHSPCRRTAHNLRQLILRRAPHQLRTAEMPQQLLHGPLAHTWNLVQLRS